MKQQACLQLMVVLTAIVTAAKGQQQQILRYAFFISGQDGEIDVSGVVPAVELAEEWIRADSSVLGEYDFQHLPVVDTLCDRTRSLNLFFSTVVESEPPVMGLLGGGCSVASEPIAEIIHNWNISQVAYDSSAIVLSNRQRFVNFFRTYPSDITFAPDVLAFLQAYGWRRIMFITEQVELFTGIYENLSRMLTQNNINTTNRVVTPSESLTQALDRVDFFFPQEDIRVIFINTYSNVARILLCEAMRTHNLVGFPRYVWITYAWYQEKWWTSAVNDEQISCEDDEIAQLLRQSLAIEVVPVPDDPSQATDVGLTTNEFNAEYLRRLDTPAARDNNYTFTFVAPIAYDAVWSLALALNSTDAMLTSWPKERVVRETNCQDDGINLDGFRLDNFTYNHSFVGCVVRWNLAQTNFTGVSGRVSFDPNGTRHQGDVTLVQYRDSAESTIERVRIGQVRSGEYVYYENESNDTVFPGGIPSDGSPVEVVGTFHWALVTIYYTLALAGIVLATVCLAFNFAFRNRKVVRLTSPNLNYFIIAGSIIMYTNIFIRLIPSTNETVNYVICNLQEILTTLAYCLAFGTVLVKVGRVYHIFHNPTAQKKTPLKDWHMAILVLVITGVGVFIAVLGWAIPQLQATPTRQPDREKGVGEDEFGVRIVHMVWECSADSGSDIVAIVIFAYLGLLQVVGIILAIQTRKVKVKVLNDSKYIAALIYISSIVLAIIVVIDFTVVGHINVAEAFYSGGLLLATTAFLCLTFIPKMVSLYKDPLGENIFSKNSSTIEVSRSGALTIKKRGDRVLELESRVKELEGLLRESMIACGESLEVSGVAKSMTNDESYTENKEPNGGTHHLDSNDAATIENNNHNVYSSDYEVTAV